MTTVYLVGHGCGTSFGLAELPPGMKVYTFTDPYGNGDLPNRHAYEILRNTGIGYIPIDCDPGGSDSVPNLLFSPSNSNTEFPYEQSSAKLGMVKAEFIGGPLLGPSSRFCTKPYGEVPDFCSWGKHTCDGILGKLYRAGYRTVYVVACTPTGVADEGSDPHHPETEEWQQIVEHVKTMISEERDDDVRDYLNTLPWPDRDRLPYSSRIIRLWSILNEARQIIETENEESFYRTIYLYPLEQELHDAYREDLGYVGPCIERQERIILETLSAKISVGESEESIIDWWLDWPELARESLFEQFGAENADLTYIVEITANRSPSGS